MAVPAASCATVTSARAIVGAESRSAANDWSLDGGFVDEQNVVDDNADDNDEEHDENDEEHDDNDEEDEDAREWDYGDTPQRGRRSDAPMRTASEQRRGWFVALEEVSHPIESDARAVFADPARALVHEALSATRRIIPELFLEPQDRIDPLCLTELEHGGYAFVINDQWGTPLSDASLRNLFLSDSATASSCPFTRRPLVQVTRVIIQYAERRAAALDAPSQSPSCDSASSPTEGDRPPAPLPPLSPVALEVATHYDATPRSNAASNAGNVCMQAPRSLKRPRM